MAAVTSVVQVTATAAVVAPRGILLPPLITAKPVSVISFARSVCCTMWHREKQHQHHSSHSLPALTFSLSLYICLWIINLDSLSLSLSLSLSRLTNSYLNFSLIHPSILITRGRWCTARWLAGGHRKIHCLSSSLLFLNCNLSNRLFSLWTN